MGANDRNAFTQGSNDNNAFIQSSADNDVFGGDATPPDFVRIAQDLIDIVPTTSETQELVP